MNEAFITVGPDRYLVVCTPFGLVIRIQVWEPVSQRAHSTNSRTRTQWTQGRGVETWAPIGARLDTSDIADLATTCVHLAFPALAVDGPTFGGEFIVYVAAAPLVAY